MSLEIRPLHAAPEARQPGFARYYLFTFTAESLYRRLAWQEMDRVDYHGHDAAVMYKDL